MFKHKCYYHKRKKVTNEKLRNGFKLKKSKVRKFEVIKKIKIKERNEFLKEVKKSKKLSNSQKLLICLGLAILSSIISTIAIEYVPSIYFINNLIIIESFLFSSLYLADKYHTFSKKMFINCITIALIAYFSLMVLHEVPVVNDIKSFYEFIIHFNYIWGLLFIILMLVDLHNKSENSD